MNQEYIFATAMGLVAPWYITKVEFKKSTEPGLMSSGQLDIYIDFQSGWKFLSESNEEAGVVHDTVERTWRHINFFQHDCYLHARIPRIKLKSGAVEQVQVPWAKPGSSFTLLFEAMSMLLVREGMSLSGAGRMLSEDGRVIGRIIERYVNHALLEQPLEQVNVIGIDEVSYKKGHSYLTIASDSERKKVVGIGIGKDKIAVSEALQEMEFRNSHADEIKHVTADLSPSFTSAILDYLPDAKIIYDRFHVEQLLSKALDTVRKQEQAEASELKKTKFIWLKNKKGLTQKQSAKIYYLSICFPKLGEAYRLKEQFKQIYNNADQIGSIRDLKEWMMLATASKIEPIIQFVNTLKNHWSGIVNYFKKQFTNAYAEQINSTIQSIKRIARGYKNVNNYITMIYFRLGGLKFDTH